MFQLQLVCTCFTLGLISSTNAAEPTRAVRAPAPPSAFQPLTLLQDPLARCMDGTQSGYYLKLSSNVSQKSWVLTLQGGGECVSSRCQEKVNTSLGSSKYFPKTFKFWNEAKVHFADASCVANPELCDYNQVFLPYCSQDLWSGLSKSVSSPGSLAPGYFFSGHLILNAVVEELATKHGMNDSGTIVLTGDSAGGFGVYNNIDWFANRLPHARVVGAPVAGYEFYAWPYQGPGHTASSLADFRIEAMAGGAYNRLWNSYVSPKCVAAHLQDPGACLLPAFSYVYLETPLFIIEAQSDSIVLNMHDWVPYIHSMSDITPPIKTYMVAFAANQSQRLAQAMSANNKNGVFNPSCFIHTGFQNTFTIKGLGYLDAFRAWLGGAQVKLSDNCGPNNILCNPTCPLSPAQ
eukprot:m.186308 g.186308  ORF g.186308 m.186308 type:complete len:405 (+) comp32260_c3_seq4:660-1874(+)